MLCEEFCREEEVAGDGVCCRIACCCVVEDSVEFGKVGRMAEEEEEELSFCWLVAP